ncbi:MAG TPA: biotin/lipoyl-containing protein [Thermoplasmata archaeon]|nr:biotin/lipoyl-containing protein [Thermoplasmata archaeon]
MKVTLELDGERREVDIDLEKGQATVGGVVVPVRVVARSWEGAELEIAGERVVVAGWPSDEPSPKRAVVVDGESYRVRAEVAAGPAGAPRSAPSAPSASAPPATAGANSVVSPMPGRVIEVRVRDGERVAPGAVLLVLEAMKMRNEVLAPRAGVVREVRVAAGASVRAREPLLSVVPE